MRQVGRERGFTIVETLVAALIITTIVAGMIFFIASSGKSQQRSGVRQQMVAQADKILQTVRSERRWLDACADCPTSTEPVNITELLGLQPPADGPAFLSNVEVLGVDSEADGLGTDDNDGLRPDLYRIQTRVWLSEQDQVEFGKVEPYETVSTVDASAIGRATGSLIVDVCEVVNQIDERASLSGCRPDGANPEVSPLRAQPDDCPDDGTVKLTGAELSGGAWPTFPFLCNKPLNTARNDAPYRAGMHVRSAPDVKFRILSEDGAHEYVSSDFHQGGGSYMFAGIPSGSYKVIVEDAGTGREVWKSRMVPSGNRLSVQANQEARALIVVRPKQGHGAYKAWFGRTTYHYGLTTEVTHRSVSKSDTLSDGRVVTVTVNYEYTWLIPRKNPSKAPVQEQWWGPAWTGFVGMGAKPFDRHRKGSGELAQYVAGVKWEAAQNSGATLIPGDTAGDNGLGTGLYSMPIQLPMGPAFTDHPGSFYGSFGKKFRCPPSGPSGPAGGGCTPAADAVKYAWMKHAPGEIGQADSSVFFHSEDGECYVTADNSVPNYVWPWNERKLVQGGNHGKRCNRDLRMDNGTEIQQFFPHKNGTEGKRYLLNVKMSASCTSCGGQAAAGGGTTNTSETPDGQSEWSVDVFPEPASNDPPPPIEITDPDGGTVVINPE